MISETMSIVQFKCILPIVVIAFLVLHTIQATPVRNCDKKGNYVVRVSKVEISPDPVISGNPATFSILASTEKPLQGGKLVIEVSFFGLHIHTENHELCTEATCPISAGDFVISHTQVLPGFTPKGRYSLKMKLVSEEGHQLTCVDFDFLIKLEPSLAEI